LPTYNYYTLTPRRWGNYANFLDAATLEYRFEYVSLHKLLSHLQELMEHYRGEHQADVHSILLNAAAQLIVLQRDAQED